MRRMKRLGYVLWAVAPFALTWVSPESLPERLRPETLGWGGRMLMFAVFWGALAAWIATDMIVGSKARAGTRENAALNLNR